MAPAPSPFGQGGCAFTGGRCHGTISGRGKNVQGPGMASLFSGCAPRYAAGMEGDGSMRNHEVTESQLLLNEQGEIAEPGWARRQVWAYRRGMIRASRLRIKEWDYYLVLHDGRGAGDRSFAAAFTLSDDGYVGLQSASLLFLDGDRPWEHTSTILNLFPMGKMHFPESSDKGDCGYRDGRLDLRFLKEDGARVIRGTFADFHEGRLLRAEIRLEQPDMDTMVIATPWDRRHAFYYNQKINTMRASGFILYGDERLNLDPAHDFGTLDWGRGVWMYDNTWYWGSGNLDMDGHAFGFNIGYGFGNTEKATENILFYDGRASKLGDVSISIPGDVSLGDMDSPRYMEPWEVHEADGRFEMRFVPVLDRSAKMDFKAIVSDQHQVFGRMTGSAVLDGGETVEIRDMLCFIEKVHNRY